MATNTLIPVGEYLSSTYRPDCDYVDGEVQERNLGEFDHGNLQATIASLLRGMRREWRIRISTEQRVRVSETRVRIPDVCVMSLDSPKEQVVGHPPLLCIEILSPDDRMSRMKERIADYVTMGVRQVWVFDPQRRMATVFDEGAMAEYRDGWLRLPGTLIAIDLAEVFAALDEE